ncbi:hypothetical protein PG991_010954 [Apiospora marii]|uniref:Uncharacterized protein n=1 Tax=Apiospora marii TaxID=335849 RepID=A0ABR1RDV1_9PEZI
MCEIVQEQPTIGVLLDWGAGRQFVSSREHAHKSENDVAEKEEACNRSESAYCLSFSCHDNGGQVRLRAINVFAAAATTATAGPATPASATARVLRRILRRLEPEVVVGDISQNPSRLQEEQRIDQQGNGGHHDARERRMSREAGEGREEEQAEPDKAEDGLSMFKILVLMVVDLVGRVSDLCRLETTYENDLHGEELDFLLRSHPRTNGKGNEERVKAASQHARYGTHFG